MASYAQLHTRMPDAFDYVHIVEYNTALVHYVCSIEDDKYLHGMFLRIVICFLHTKWLLSG